MSRKNRLDLLMVAKGVACSRQKAQELIRAGKVRDVNGRILDKPGQEYVSDIKLLVKESPRFVSRGGQKLLAALEAFPIEVKGRVCLDAGISTGGFTDCLLQHGAEHIYGIDVGYGQTAWKLRIDPKLFLKERTNVRNLAPEDLYEPSDPLPTLLVADLSFISLRLVMPSLKALLDPDHSEAILLVKPQFEVGKHLVGKKGVVRDPLSHVKALEGVIDAAKTQAWNLKGIKPSPITGPAGNHEYLIWFGTTSGNELPSLPRIVSETLN